MPNTTTKIILDQIPMLPKREDDLNSQLKDMIQVSIKLGCFDTANLMQCILNKRIGKDVCCNKE